MSRVLFQTIHGSHLYGLAHEGSDVDTFTVVENTPGRSRARYAKQKVNDLDDSLETNLSTFFQYAQKGVPQYLEAMYAPHPEIDWIRDLRFAYQPDLYETERTYIRTIRNFWAQGTYKKRRHAARLLCNLETLRLTGRFNPTLTPLEAEYCHHTATGAYTLDLPLAHTLDMSHLL